MKAAPGRRPTPGRRVAARRAYPAAWSGRTISLALAVGLVTAPGLAAQVREPAPARSALAGVFTPQQADDGGALFEQTCSRCHSTQELSGPRFRGVWTGRALSELYALVSTTMPLDQPASFAPEQYAALVAYLLTLNGYPAGSEALGWRREELSTIRLDPAPGSGPAPLPAGGR